MHAIRGEIARIQDKTNDAVNEYKAAIANLPAEPAEGPLYGIQLHMDMSDLYRRSVMMRIAARSRGCAGNRSAKSTIRARAERHFFVFVRRSNWHQAISMVHLQT